MKRLENNEIDGEFQRRNFKSKSELLVLDLVFLFVLFRLMLILIVKLMIPIAMLPMPRFANLIINNLTRSSTYRLSRLVFADWTLELIDQFANWNFPGASV